MKVLGLHSGYPNDFIKTRGLYEGTDYLRLRDICLKIRYSYQAGHPMIFN